MTSPRCEICRSAYQIARRASRWSGVKLTTVDITLHPELQQLYQFRVPVITLPDTKQVIAEGELRTFLLWWKLCRLRCRRVSSPKGQYG